MADINIGALPFSEQIAFFRQKQNLGTRAWTDIWQEQHDRAFVVAGAMKRELLNDFRESVDQVIAEGLTLQEFQNQFDDIVAKHGWQFNGGRNWRARVIYDTNLRTSYQAGRLAQLQDPDLLDAAPFWMYIHSDLVVTPRPQHLEWDGLILPADDPWWDTHYPPNGWGCKCRVRPITRRQLGALGKTAPDTAPPVRMRTVTVGKRGPTPRTVRVPEGIDPGWAFKPGDSWVRSFSPPQIDDLIPSASAASTTSALPVSRSISPTRILPPDLNDQSYVNAFLREFGVDTDAGERMTIFRDVAGQYLVISDDLFRERDGTLKANKRGRGPFVLLFADTIKLPDEIYEDWVQFPELQHPILRRRYIATFDADGDTVPSVAVFETGPQGWVGVTANRPDRMRNLLNRSRRGTRVFRREE